MVFIIASLACSDFFRIDVKLTFTLIARDSMWTMLLRGLVIKEKMLIWKINYLLKRYSTALSPLERTISALMFCGIELENAMLILN